MVQAGIGLGRPLRDLVYPGFRFPGTQRAGLSCSAASRYEPGCFAKLLAAISDIALEPERLGQGGRQGCDLFVQSGEDPRDRSPRSPRE